MHVFRTKRETRYFIVICMSCHKMEPSVRQEVGETEKLSSIHFGLYKRRHVGDRASECKHGLLQDVGDLTDSESTSCGMLLYIWWWHFCAQFMGMQKTDGSVTQHHGSWRDTSPRMARLLASMLWDIVIDVLELYASRARADPSRPLPNSRSHKGMHGSANRVRVFFFWRRWGCYQEISVKYAHTNHKIADILKNNVHSLVINSIIDDFVWYCLWVFPPHSSEVVAAVVPLAMAKRRRYSIDDVSKFEGASSKSVPEGKRVFSTLL